MHVQLSDVFPILVSIVVIHCYASSRINAPLFLSGLVTCRRFLGKRHDNRLYKRSVFLNRSVETVSVVSPEECVGNGNTSVREWIVVSCRIRSSDSLLGWQTETFFIKMRNFAPPVQSGGERIHHNTPSL